MISALQLMDSFFHARRNFCALRGDLLKSYQDKRAQAIVTQAVKNSPFYAQHYRHSDHFNWRKLPTIDKQIMMANFGEINTHGVTLEEAMTVALTAEHSRDFSPTLHGLTVGLSSGTSGHRGLFLANRSEQARWVGAVLARLLPPFRVRGYTVTLFSMSGSNLYDDLQGRWIRFYHHDLATGVDEAVCYLNKEQPDLLCGPPSYLQALATMKSAEELHISPCKIVCVAEVLEPHIARLLEESFGCPAFQIYQCTEGLVGMSCPHGRLHAQEDLVASQFEPLTSDSDSPLTPIITDLWHRTLPIIRYRLNDVVTLSPDSCPCGSGFQVIESVAGRCDDVCEFIDTKGSSQPVFPAAIRRLVLLADDAIMDYEAVQERSSQLCVSITLTPEADPVRKAAVVQRMLVSGLKELGAASPQIEVKTGEIAPVIGKRRHVRRINQPKVCITEV